MRLFAEDGPHCSAHGTTTSPLEALLQWRQFLRNLLLYGGACSRYSWLWIATLRIGAVMEESTDVSPSFRQVHRSLCAAACRSIFPCEMSPKEDKRVTKGLPGAGVTTPPITPGAAMPSNGLFLGTCSGPVDVALACHLARRAPT